MNPYAILAAAALTGGTIGVALAQVVWVPEILLGALGAGLSVLWLLFIADD